MDFFIFKELSVEYPNYNKNEDLFKRFTQSIKQNDLETFNTIKQHLTDNAELKAYFMSQLQFNSANHDPIITLLYYAVYHQNYAFAKTLLELKANADEISGMFLQPTSFSLPQASSSIAYFSNFNEKHPVSLEQEESPLVLAAFLKNHELTYLLISYGADPLIYDATTRCKDFVLREAQAFVLKVRDEWIKAPLENTINNLKAELSMLSTDSDSTSEQSGSSPKAFM